MALVCVLYYMECNNDSLHKLWTLKYQLVNNIRRVKLMYISACNICIFTTDGIIVVHQFKIIIVMLLTCHIIYFMGLRIDSKHYNIYILHESIPDLMTGSLVTQHHGKNCKNAVGYT